MSGQPYPPGPAPESVHALRVALLLDDRVRVDGDLVYELLGFYPHMGELVTVDGDPVPWRVHGVDGTEIKWLERLRGGLNARTG